MIRVVLDTNILISALLTPQGPPTQVFLIDHDAARHAALREW
jgi:predicted nucleic acid-binding protein